jgi:hypothetical protein
MILTGKPEKNLSHCHSTHHMDWTVIEAIDLLPESWHIPDLSQKQSHQHDISTTTGESSSRQFVMHSPSVLCTCHLNIWGWLHCRVSYITPFFICHQLIVQCAAACPIVECCAS